MPVDDFSTVVEPWLRQLKDDPKHPPPDNLETTTFPLGGKTLRGKSSR